MGRLSIRKPVIHCQNDDLSGTGAGPTPYSCVITMDEDNFDQAMALRPGKGAQVVRMVDYCEASDVDEVPDPYYGGEEGFHAVIDILEDGCFNLLKRCASI